MQTWLNKLFNVRPGEWSRLLLLSALLLISNLGSGWGLPVVYAAFLEQLELQAGLQTLVWVILLSSILSIPAMAIYGLFADRIDNNKMFVYIVAADGLIIFSSLMILAVSVSGGFAFPALYVLSLASTAVFNPHFFTYVNEIYDIQSAKRAMPLILAAGRTGSVLAGFTLQLLTKRLTKVELIWIWLLTDLVVIGIILSIPYITGTRKKSLKDKSKLIAQEQKARVSSMQSFKEILNFILQSQFLRWIAIGTLLLTALMTLLEYDFNKVMVPLFDTPTGYAGYTYAGFIGMLNGVSNLVAMIILLFVISRVTKSWGLGNTSLVFPFTVLLISGSMARFPGIIPASLSYLGRKGLRFSLLSPVESLLYNAIPLRIKGRARALIGGQIAPLGAIFGVLLLVLNLNYGVSWPWLLSSFIVLLSVAYMLNAFLVRTEYTRALVKMLEEEDYSFLLSDEATELVVADPATLQRLQKKLDESTNHEMRIFMTQLITQVGGSESLNVLVPAITATAEARTRAAMLNVLAASGLQGSKIKDLFVNFLSDSDPQVRKAATAGLEQLLGEKDPWLQEKMLELVEDPDNQVSIYALQALANTDDFYKFDVAVQKLNQLLSSEQVENTKNAINVLGRVSRSQSIEQILGFLDNENDQIRLEAILELENLPLPLGNALDARILNAVRPLLQDPVTRVRQASLQIIGRYKLGNDGYASLAAVLGDKSPQVRAKAADVLVAIGKDVIPLIQAELKSPDSQVQDMAAVVLSRIQPRQFSALIEAKVSDNLGIIYQNIGFEDALGNYEKHSSVKVLLAALRESNHECIDEILYLLSAIHTPETLKVVKDSLDSDSPSTRNLALEALESLTSPKVATLIAYLFEPSMETGQLTQFGRETLNIEQFDIVQTFEKLLDPSKPKILRLMAVHALGDVCSTGLSRPPKKAASRVSRLFDAIDATPSEPRTSVPSVSPDLRSLLEKIQNGTDPLFQQAAQSALQKLDKKQKELETDDTISLAWDESVLLSVVERLIILKEMPFFRNITITQLEPLAMVCEQKKYEKNARIFQKDDSGGVLYMVVDGQVGIEKEKRVGSALLATIEKGSYFGEMSLFDDSPRSASAIAMQDSIILVLNRAPIIGLTMQNPDLALELINVLSQRIRDTSNRIAETARSRPRELHKLYDQFD